MVRAHSFVQAQHAPEEEGGGRGGRGAKPWACRGGGSRNQREQEGCDSHRSKESVISH